MTPRNDGSQSIDSEVGTSVTPPPTYRPIEMYAFLDPLCADCWALEPVFKKLEIEYGKYIKRTNIIGGDFIFHRSKRLCDQGSEDLTRQAWRSGDRNVWAEDPTDTPFAAYIAVKAAEMQGRKAGNRFLQRVRETLFLQPIVDDCKKSLRQCAAEAHLDVEEFERDLYSPLAMKAFHQDIKVTKDMSVNKFPSIVFFNDNIDDDGLKVSGVHAYETYVTVLKELLYEHVSPDSPPRLEDFLRKYRFVSTKEIAVVYGLPYQIVERKMKELTLMRVVERVPLKYGMFWRYMND